MADSFNNRPKQQNVPNREEPQQDDEELGEMAEKDETEGRASLVKYADNKQKEGSQKGNSIVDSVSNYMKASVQEPGSSGKRAKDTYYYDLQEFIDNTLKSIASKIAEKKSVELETSSLKIELNKIKEEIKKEEQMQKVIKKNLEQEIEVSRKREKENLDLEELLRALQEKTGMRKNEINEKLAETEAICDQAKEIFLAEQSKFLSIKKQIEDERAEARTEIKNLEIEHADASTIIEDLKKKISHGNMVEHERVKMLREKSKVLAALIGQETTVGKTSLHKGISKILKSPQKQASVMHSASRSYSKV